ncbi:hypothetical protein RYX36_016493 [Vicia faba]
MRENGCSPNVVTYTIMLLGYDKAGLKDAYDVFEDMPKQGIVRDVVTFNTMITTAYVHLKEETSLRLLKKMEESSCKPNIQSYHPLLKI